MPGPIQPKLPPFVIGDLSDATLKNLEGVRGRLTEAVRAVSDRDVEIQRLAGVNGALQQQLDNVGTTLQNRTLELGNARQELATQVTLVQELRVELEKIKTATPKIRVQDLVQQFKSNVDLINTQVIQGKTAGMVVDNVEVEVRGGIDVTSGLQITQLPVSQLGSSTVSTLKFNLRPTVALKIVDED